MADLGTVAKAWYLDAELKKKLGMAGGIASLVITKGSNAIIVQDRWHAVVNRRVLLPVMDAMRVQHKIKTPSLKALEDQVWILEMLFKGLSLNVSGGLPPPPEELVVPIHCVASSIKKLISFTRRMKLRSHTPQDQGAVLYVQTL